MRRLVLLALAAAFASCASAHAQTVIAPGSNNGGGGSGTVMSCATTNATPRYTGATTLDCGSPVDTLTDFALSGAETFTLSSSTSGLKTVQSTDTSGEWIAKQVLPPPIAVTATISAGAGVNAGTHSYKITYSTASGETSAGAVSNTVTTAGGNQQVTLTAVPFTPLLVTGYNVYRTIAGNAVTGPWKLVAAAQGPCTFPSGCTYVDSTADGALGVTIPSTNTTSDFRFGVNPSTDQTFIGQGAYGYEAYGSYYQFSINPGLSDPSGKSGISSNDTSVEIVAGNRRFFLFVSTPSGHTNYQLTPFAPSAGDTGGGGSELFGVSSLNKIGGDLHISAGLTNVAAVADITLAGANLLLTGTNAVAGDITNGAAAGGAVTITAGNAARLNTGNAQGGDITLTPGTGIGTGRAGANILSGPIQTTGGTTPTVANVGANSCGTSAATSAGNENYGIITVGATAGSQCRLTFATAAPTRRVCQFQDETTKITIQPSYVDTTHTDVLGVFVAGDVISFHCGVY